MSAGLAVADIYREISSVVIQQFSGASRRAKFTFGGTNGYIPVQDSGPGSNF